MIRAVGNRRLFLSEEEFDNYKKLTKIVDKSDFVGLFESDQNGNITSITFDPEKNISMASMAFINHVMINQRFRLFADALNNNSKKIENNRVSIEKVASAAKNKIKSGG